VAKKNIYFKYEMLILTILSQGDYYGYEITSKIKKLTDNFIDVKAGILYPSLYKMLDKGYITSEDVLINRKIRVYYHLNDTGKDYLEKTISEYYEWERKINNVLDTIQLK